MDDKKINLSTTARRLVEESPFKTSYLAEECGITPKTFGQILNGKKRTSRAVLKLLAMKLQVPESELIQASTA